jgi:hypothetical protein
MRKLRQYPVDFGVGTLMESVAEPELAALGLRFFNAMGWRGPGSIEFKRDGRRHLGACPCHQRDQHDPEHPAALFRT